MDTSTGAPVRTGPDRKVQGPPPILLFSEVRVGYCFPREHLTITHALIDAFEACLNLPAAFPASAPVLGDPPRRLVPVFLLNELFSMKRHVRIPVGTLHAQEHLEISAPVFVDEALAVDIRITDKYVRNDRKFVTTQQSVIQPGASAPALKITRLFCWAH